MIRVTPHLLCELTKNKMVKIAIIQNAHYYDDYD